MSIARMMQDYGFHKEYINTLISDKKILDYVHNIIAQGYDPKTVAKWVCGPVCARLNTYDTTIDFLKYDMQQFTTFLDMIDSYNIQDTQAKMVIEQLLDTGEPVDTIVHHL
jgi:Asp-tRNA(Asn)/Glu-tRNA(Gln) amidotransferase B subunit